MKQTYKLNRRLDIHFDPPKHEEAPFFDYCPKFQTKYHPKNSLDRIVAYLYLKEKGVNGKTFSQRRICKHDSTQTWDGPPDMRKLKIKPPGFNKLNGWQNVGGELKYDYDNGWKVKVDEICIDSEHNEQIQKHFSKKEEEIKHDYKARIQQFRNYFQSIDDMYKIKQMPESIKQFRQLYKKSREELKPYVKYKGQRFFEVLPLLQERGEETLVKEFKAFQPLTDLKLKEKTKFIDDLFKHLNKHKRETQEHSEDEEQDDQQQIDEHNPKIQRAFSQLLHKDVGAEASEFNQEHYLFEVKDVNSFGQQIRMNKLNSIMNKMFQSQHNFQKDLQSYSYNKLQPNKVNDISTDNINQLQNSRLQMRNKEIKRMSKSQYDIPLKKSRQLHSAFATTATSNLFKQS